MRTASYSSPSWPHSLLRRAIFIINTFCLLHLQLKQQQQKPQQKQEQSEAASSGATATVAKGMRRLEFHDAGIFI